MHNASFMTRMKEALCIKLTPEDAPFNRDSGYKLPDCWVTTLCRLGGGVATKRTLDLGVTRPQGRLGRCLFLAIYRSVSQDQLHSTLRRTG